MAFPKLTVTSGSSLSVMLTVDVLVVPAVTRAGSVPKASLTRSPSSLTVSSVAVKVNVLEVCPLLKVTLAGMLKSPAVAPLCPVPASGIVTVRSGSALSLTVTVTVEPSLALYAALPKLTVTSGSSLSVMLTVDVLVVPAVTRAGSVPKASLTRSPSSLTVSSVAVKVNVFDVSPLSKVTLAGMLKSPAVAPFCPVPASGIVTVRSGSALSLTVTVTSPPSSTLYAALAKRTVTAGSSLSAMLTVDVLVVPAVTRVGSVPKASLTRSPSSLTVSSVAVKVNVFDVSPLLKVTVAGTPE